MNTVEIVPIREEHAEGFHRALDTVARERRYLSFLEAPPAEATRAFIRDNIDHGFPQFVALRDNEVVGWCDVRPKARPIHAHVGILGMGLLLAFRGQGLGLRLIQQALAASRQFGFHRVELTVRVENANAVALYRKVGFEFEGRLRDDVCVDGVYGDLLVMGVLL
ncbi:GNAT family N-acetyltransferase [Bradyrhizobium tropiciagri]|uniref:GNAT family N-acetyltransferase n=1 Tax=Bradyrhizobium tropiciagri TaxID=312253 RepID=UPI001BAC4BFC|nr:GNAT family N-acetyltransferase [Bradyrhizobium tropiciagri]MBR0894141.1 GNAT family N-acetyltransferase [Bradyrhizobium tropiciagri]